MTKATALKAKKQISEAVSQGVYKSMEKPFQLYNVMSVVDKTIVATNFTMNQAVRTFVPITKYILMPTKGA
jgi:DNA-binding NtrC family response regulator